MRVLLLTEYHLEFLSLKGGCTDSSKSTLVKMTHCWKSHVATLIEILMVSNRNFRSRVQSPLKKLAGLFYFLIFRAMTIYWNTFVTFHKVFCARCGTNCIDFWYLPSSLLFILTRVGSIRVNTDSGVNTHRWLTIHMSKNTELWQRNVLFQP